MIEDCRELGTTLQGYRIYTGTAHEFYIFVKVMHVMSFLTSSVLKITEKIFIPGVVNLCAGNDRKVPTGRASTGK